jgi:hypothetical protein
MQFIKLEVIKHDKGLYVAEVVNPGFSYKQLIIKGQ